MASKANATPVRRSSRLAAQSAPSVNVTPPIGVISGRITKKVGKVKGINPGLVAANAVLEVNRKKRRADELRSKRLAELQKRSNVEHHARLQHEEDMVVNGLAFNAGMETMQWNVYLNSILPFRFFDLPVEIQNMVYSNLVKDVPSSDQRLTPALIGYSDRVSDNLTHQQEHFQWLFTKLARVPLVGPAFMLNFFCTTTIYLDFFEFTNPFYGESLTEFGNYMFQSRTRRALDRIRAILTRFRHIHLMVSEGNMIGNVADEHLKDVVDRILLPRHQANGIVTVSINLDHILRLHSDPFAVHGKLGKIVDIIKALQVNTTVRLEMSEPDLSKEAPGSIRVKNIRVTRFYLESAGVDLTSVTIGS